MTSIDKKQIVAATGLLLILFIVAHLLGNLTLFLGPEAFNAYAKKVTGLRPALYVVECLLAGIFLIHIFLTAQLVVENRSARPVKYAQGSSSHTRSLATRVMPYTGTILFIFIICHLLDFTFVDKHGLYSMVKGEDLGLYGVVYNAFTDPIHSGFYIVAMMSLGFHLAHGIQSFAQTYGFNHPQLTPKIKQISIGAGALIAIAYSLIPIYVLLGL